jgi:DNA-binding Lrp family transcriptional regulator
VKNIVEKLQKSGLIFKSLKKILPKELGSRKKIEIYLGVDIKSFYVAIFFVTKKSRILQKEAKEFIELHKRLEKYNDSAIKKKYLYIEVPICSKAREFLEEKGWRVIA